MTAAAGVVSRAASNGAAACSCWRARSCPGWRGSRRCRRRRSPTSATCWTSPSPCATARRLAGGGPISIPGCRSRWRWCCARWAATPPRWRGWLPPSGPRSPRWCPGCSGAGWWRSRSVSWPACCWRGGRGRSCSRGWWRRTTGSSFPWWRRRRWPCACCGRAAGARPSRRRRSMPCPSGSARSSWWPALRWPSPVPVSRARGGGAGWASCWRPRWSCSAWSPHSAAAPPVARRSAPIAAASRCSARTCRARAGRGSSPGRSSPRWTRRCSTTGMPCRRRRIGWRCARRSAARGFTWCASAPT